MQLSKSQRLAIDYVDNYARRFQKEAKLVMNHVLEMSNISMETYENSLKAIKDYARVSLHFHPDRLNHQMVSVVDSLLKDGVYKSQFETLISNGSVSAYEGGERDLWEERMFGGAYQKKGTNNKERPKYGALNLMLHSDGPSPRFGSCYFLLYPQVSYRSTFSYMDSHLQRRERGTYQEFDMVLAALLEESFTREFVLGESNMRPPRLIHHFLTNLSKSPINTSNIRPIRNLDYYIEAQVHGEISLERDVEMLVADNCFKDTDIGKCLYEICDKYSIDLQWRSGYKLRVEDIPADFRGARMPGLASRISKNNNIDARTIGLAVKDLNQHPENWKDYGTTKTVLQELKLLWHVLVRYG